MCFYWLTRKDKNSVMCISDKFRSLKYCNDVPYDLLLIRQYLKYAN